jgi:hypothetical protein
MIITKIYIAAMSRADVSYSRMVDLPAFYFYVDEFQSFANETFANILSEARKYKLALIIAHQYIAQMEESVRDAVFGNVGTSLSFRVGPLDAEILEKVYAPQFTANDLINLGMAQVYLSLMINDIGSQPFSAKTLPPIPRPNISYRNDVIEWTRSHFAKPKETVENNIKDWFAKDAAPVNNFSKDSDKSFKDIKKPVLTYTPKQVTPSITKPKEEVKYHTPFKKALQPALEKIKQPSNENIISYSSNKEQSIKPSPELSRLLDSIDGSKPKISENPKTLEAAPFVGEKPLKETITPPKYSERGPTQANRNLLKEALLKATGSINSTVESKDTTLPKPEPQITKATQKESNGEVSHEELKKILES